MLSIAGVTKILKVQDSGRVERVFHLEPDITSYLEKDLVRNSLAIWYLTQRDNRFELYIFRNRGSVMGHLTIYNTPEGIYSDLGGDNEAAEQLLYLVPKKCVLTALFSLKDLVEKRIRYDCIYPNDLMQVTRGEQILKNPAGATRLSAKEHSEEYSKFGSSFNVPPVPMEWIRESLDKGIVYGVLRQGKIAAVASLVSWLPKVAVIMGVETKPEFRRKGLAAIVVSATVQEGLTLSESCILFVRSDNVGAIALYKSLGFKKVGEELWIDIGTGMIP